jgi:hypothetical protein
MFIRRIFMVLVTVSQNVFMTQINGCEETRALHAISSGRTHEPFCRKKSEGAVWDFVFGTAVLALLLM